MARPLALLAKLKLSLAQDETGYMGVAGFFGLIPLAIVAILAFFGIGMVASISWRPVLAIMAMGIIGIAFIGVVFFKANFNMVIFASIISISIVFIAEISLPVIVGAGMVLGAVWYMKMLKTKPLMFALLVIGGLVVMLAGKYMILVPLGVLP